LTTLEHLSLARTQVADASSLRPLVTVLDQLDLCDTKVDHKPSGLEATRAGTDFFDDVTFCGGNGLVSGCATRCGEVKSPLP
jgi:hypothetical protein